MPVDVEVLHNWRASLIRDIEELRGRILPLEEQVKRKQEELSAVDNLLALQGVSDVPKPPAESALLTNRSSRSSLDCAYELLLEAGKPFHYKELHARLLDRGVRIPGQNPAANLLAHVNRDPRFRWVGRGTYGLAEWGPAKTKQRTKRKKRRSRR